jgi:adenine-specific DNA-methyltransferase
MPGYDITSITIVHNPRGNITNNFARTHEYALYAIPRGQSVIERTQKDNASPRKLRRWGHNSTRKARPTMFYPIYVKNGKVVRIGSVPEDNFHPSSKNVISKNGEIEVWPIDRNGIERRWNFGLDTIEDELQRIVAIENDGETDLFLTQEDTTPKTVWTDSNLEAGRNGASLVRSITGVDFPFPKSIYTLIRCLDLVVRNRPTAIVLDFFAGSGTTGHAVLELNKHDDGQRQFILCTNNENNICDEVCYPRIQKVMAGYNDSKDQKVDGLGGNLKYYKTDFVDAEPTDKNKKKLTEQATEMLCLKEGTFEIVISKKIFKIYKNNNHYTGIIFDQTAIPDFKKAAAKFDKPVNVYVFSLGEDDFSEEFADMKKAVKVCPIPEVILRVYRRIFK